jgi:hypothetical protein
MKRKISLIFVLMLFSTVTTLGLINNSPTSVKGNSSDFTAHKRQLIAQSKAQRLKQANQYHATHPNTNPIIVTMGPDPQIKAERIPPEIGWGLGWLLTGPYNVSELWIVGDKPYNKMKMWNPYYAYSGNLKANPQQGFIGTFVLNGASDESLTDTWNTPQLWGSVTITYVTCDLVSFFCADSGVNGTFNLTTHEWKTD